MTGATRLILVGCGGHASDVLSVVEACNRLEIRYEVIGYLDDDPLPNARRVAARGISHLGGIDDDFVLRAPLLLGIGYPLPRRAVADRLRARGGRLADPVVHPRAELATGVELGPGAVVFPGVQVGPLARVGEGAMLGRGAVVGHDTVISDYASVMPAAVLSGGCTVGAGALVGTNATVLEGVSIGEGARLGAGAVLTRDLPAGATAVGVPARVVSGDRSPADRPAPASARPSLPRPRR